MNPISALPTGSSRQGHRLRVGLRASAMAWWLLSLLGWLLLAHPAAHAQVLEVPALTARVIDQTGTLSEPQRQALEAQLSAFEQERGTQIVVLLVPTTQPEDIAAYANRIANVWKVGRRDVGDGLLVVLAKNDRRLRIEVAKSLEGAVPDLAARRVIDNDMTPRLKQGDFAGALQAGTQSLMSLVRNEGLPTPSESGPEGPRGTFVEVLLQAAWPAYAMVLGLLSLAGRRVLFTFGGAIVATGLLLAGGFWWSGASAEAARWAAVAGIPIGLVLLGMVMSPAGMGSLAQHQGTVRGVGRRRSVHRWTAGSSWSSGSSSSSSSSDSGSSFSSGGGGDFGGGGSSGSW